jgi:hypothetical protein
MVALTRESSQVIRATDPGARIVSAAAAGVGVKWLDEFLRKGGGQYVDIIRTKLKKGCLAAEEVGLEDEI